MKKNLFLSALLLIIVFNSTVSAQTQEKKNKIVVGVFSGNGAGATSIVETIEALKIDTGILPIPVSAADIQGNILNEIDVLIFPGGSGSKQLNNLGQSGADRVHKFVKKQGKGVVGICAGGYILSTTPTYYSLELTSAKNIDRAHYDRGRGLVEFKLSEQGFQVFPELKDNSLFLQYYDGPILQPGDSLNIKYTELGTYVTDIHPHKGYPSGITPGKSILLTEKVGKGHIFVVAGHPESTPGMRWMIPRMARWAANSKLVSYDKKWVRPELNDSAILFTSELGKYEKKQRWALYSDKADEKITAMDNLYKIRSRPAVRWNIGLLRDHDPKIRIKAAKLLMETEYTAAITDLLIAHKVEKNKKVKKQMAKAIDFLSGF
ncbi:MAG: BPL-N domain-containing protein [Bacteroidota bacterium]